MSISISVFEFFSYAIPGGLYLFAIAYLLNILQVTTIDFRSTNFSAIQVFAFVVFSYPTGLIFSPLSNKLWYRLFDPKNVSSTSLEELKQKNPHLKMRFRPKDWPVLMAYIRQENKDVMAEIQRFKATHIMLRNVSFGLLLLAVALIVQVMVENNFSPVRLSSSIVLIILSIVAAKESTKFDKWFFLSIYESMIAYSLRKKDLVIEDQVSAHEENAS